MNYRVPLLDLNAQFQDIKPEIKAAIEEVLDSQHFIMGESVKNFEKEVGEYCNSEHALSCASGSDALLLALMAIDIQQGDYVITSPFTFFATAGAISRLGAIPVFVDIEPDSFNIDPKEIALFLKGENELAKRLKPDPKRIKAIIPVHLYGQMAEMDPIIELAREYGLYVIEDAAQSIGSIYKGNQAGTMGDFGCFSFFPSKNLGAYGDAGLVTVKDPELAEKLDILRLHGARPKYHHKYVGINSRLDTIQASILSVKMKYLDEWSERRKKVADTYNQYFSEVGLTVSDLAEENGIILPKETTGSVDRNGRHIYHQYTVRSSRRDEFQQWLTEKGVGTSVYYPISLHQQECFSDLGYNDNDCPNSTKASKEALSLPIYPELTSTQIEYVVSSIKEFFDK